MRILLFSGGIDSTALAWWLRPDLLFFIDYGQRSAEGELRAARAIAREVGLPLDVRTAKLGAFGHGTMANGDVLNTAAPEFWPYRNQMLVTLAAMAHAGKKVDSLIIGSVSGDERHPDGTARFRSTINKTLSTQGGPRLDAPCAHLSTEDLIRKANVPLSVLGWTFSCHTGEWACGSCNGCIKHSQVMDGYRLMKEHPDD